MKHIESYDAFLTEGKAVGVLYHYTILHYLVSIMRENMLRVSDAYYHAPCVSLSRSAFMPNSINASEARLVIDGTKLADDYKIVPFLYHDLKSQRVTDPWHYKMEAEEQVLENITDVKRYLLGVEVLENRKYNLEKMIAETGPLGYNVTYVKKFARR